MKIQIRPAGSPGMIYNMEREILRGDGTRKPNQGGIVFITDNKGVGILGIEIDGDDKITLRIPAAIGGNRIPLADLVKIDGYHTEIVHQKGVGSGIHDRLNAWNQKEYMVSTDFIESSLDIDGNGNICEEDRELAALISEAKSDGVKMLWIV